MPRQRILVSGASPSQRDGGRACHDERVQIFHIATASDWAEALASGVYATSTRGRTLEQEGFLHAARREQVPEVLNRYFLDAGEPLVLLTIDTDRLEVPWREDRVGSETFPHIYGALAPDAVTRVLPLEPTLGVEV